jgi:hypothetical protein
VLLAEQLNATPKYVVTSTLDSADDWRNSEIIGYGDAVTLRDRLDLLSYGCGALARDLLRDGRTDRTGADRPVWRPPAR